MCNYDEAQKEPQLVLMAVCVLRAGVTPEGGRALRKAAQSPLPRGRRRVSRPLAFLRPRTLPSGSQGRGEEVCRSVTASQKTLRLKQVKKVKFRASASRRLKQNGVILLLLGPCSFPTDSAAVREAGPGSGLPVWNPLHFVLCGSELMCLLLPVKMVISLQCFRQVILKFVRIYHKIVIFLSRKKQKLISHLEIHTGEKQVLVSFRKCGF